MGGESCLLATCDLCSRWCRAFGGAGFRGDEGFALVLAEVLRLGLALDWFSGGTSLGGLFGGRWWIGWFGGG